MTQNFLRYSPDVEKPEPDFDRTLQAILDGMKQRMRGSIEDQQKQKSKATQQRTPWRKPVLHQNAAGSQTTRMQFVHFK